MMQMNRYFFLITCSILLGFLTSCNGDDCFSSCRSNDSDFYGEIDVKVTINAENPAVVVTLYDGNFDSGTTIGSLTTTDDRVSFGDFQSDRSYAATALYMKDGQEILAVDGGFLGVSEDDCGCPTGAIDLTLNLKLLD